MANIPHTGIIDESLVGEQRLLARARLHVKGGLERFARGETADAIAAFYDAVSSAMQRLVLLDGIEYHLLRSDEDVSEDRTLFRVLLKSGIFSEGTTQDDFDFIEQTLDDAFEGDLETFDEISYTKIAIGLLNQLGVVSEDMNNLTTQCSP
jgi:hypothetical protein